jgi:thioredoxin 1
VYEHYSRRLNVGVHFYIGVGMSNFVQINEENFEAEVLQSDVPVLVEFGAVWCGPCKRVEPELEKLGELLSGRLKLAKLDVDESVDVTMRFQVMSVPTMVLFVNGVACTRMSGFQPRDRIMDKIEAYIS